MAKHTPGPWVVEENSSPPLIWGNDYEKPVAEVELHRSYADYVDGEAQANARLIAAAPDMLEALENLVAKYNAMQDGNIGAQLTNGDFFAARAAIAKAKGQAE